jgi:outer membrane murein-binding lipoprotein Lpp
MRFKKLITPLLITVIICATLALGYQQNTLRLPNPRLQNPFFGAGQTLKKDDQSAGVKELYSRITNLESKVSRLEKGILWNPFSGAGQTLKKDDQSAGVKELYSRITNLESKVFSLEKDLQIFAGTPCAPINMRLCVPEPDFQKPRDIPYQQDPLRRGLPNPFSGAGQTLKKDDQSAGVKDLYSRITNLESKVFSLEKRIEDLQKAGVIPANQK